MKVRNYAGFCTGLLLGFFILSGLGFLSVNAAGPAYNLYSASWCGPCQQIKAQYQGLIDSGQIKVIDVSNANANLPAGSTYNNGSIPYMEQVGADGAPIKNSGKTGGDQIGPELEKLKNAPVKQPDETICIVPRPGWTPAFGPITNDHPILGQLRDFEAPVIPIWESQINFSLRRLGSNTMEIQLSQADSQAVTQGKKIVIKPVLSQARQYVDSMGGNPNARGSYMIGGVDVPVGKYRANQKDDVTGIVFDDTCQNPKKEAITDPNKNPFASDSGFGNVDGAGGGGNVPGAGGGGGLGGLGGGNILQSLLPMLMQGLLGGQGQQQGQYGAGYGDQTCAQYGAVPVCGTDGKTYTNSCYLQQLGVPLKSNGVCPAPSTSPTPTPNPTSNEGIVATLNSLSQSGIPTNILDSVRNAIAAILSGVLSGTSVGQTVVP